MVTSRNRYIFDLEETGNHGDPVGDVHWYYAWDANRYDGSNCARTCYAQNYSGGTYGDCAIVYDALGGARKAYTVRSGMWQNAQGNGWSQPDPSGPQGPLGMPITNEYAIDGGIRQDFQKGHLTYVNANGQVTSGTYPACAPGWTSTGWNNQYSYLFALAFERNGGRVTVGYPSGYVQQYGPYLRQDFTGGTYGNCCIMYDSNNAVGNDAATNEAYLLHTGFYSYYQSNGDWHLGCPTRDEYSSRDPEHWDQSTEYPLQNFFDREAYNLGEASQHYMIWKNGAASYHSAYTTQYVSQDPAGLYDTERNQTRTYTVRFKNTGSNSWYNSDTHPDAYVTLKSTDPSGEAAYSFLNNPYDVGLNWIDSETPCTMQETSVAPGDTATFTFTGKVASNADLGLTLVYFRPYHSVAGLLEGWWGMHFQVNVEDPPPPPEYHAKAMASGDFDNDGHVDDLACIYDYPGSECRIHLWLGTGTAFDYQGPTGWWYLPSGYPSENVRKFASGDFDGDGFKDDLVALYDYGLQASGRMRSCLHVWLGTGDSLIYQTPQGWWIFDGYDADSVVGLASGDFDEDGDDDLAALYDYPGSECSIHLFLSTRTSFAYEGSNGWWHLESGYPSENVRFFLGGDVDGDGDCDLSAFYDYGLQGNGKYRTAIHVWASTGDSLIYQGASGWWLVDGYELSKVTQAVSGYFNNDARSDVATFYDYGYIPAVGKYRTRIHVWTSTASSYTYSGSNGWWSIDGYNAQSVIHAIPGYFNGDGYSDITSAYDYNSGDTSRFHVFTSTGSAFTYQGPSGWWWSPGYPLPKQTTEGSDQLILPSTFSLCQNYPNPFNPVTVISYSLPEATNVKLDIFNILGQRVTTLVDEHQGAGEHFVTWQADKFSTGIYLYRIETPEVQQTRKMLLLK